MPYRSLPCERHIIRRHLVLHGHILEVEPVERLADLQVRDALLHGRAPILNLDAERRLGVERRPIGVGGRSKTPTLKLNNNRAN